MEVLSPASFCKDINSINEAMVLRLPKVCPLNAFLRSLGFKYMKGVCARTHLCSQSNDMNVTCVAKIKSVNFSFKSPF